MILVPPAAGHLAAGFFKSEALNARRGYLAYLPPSYKADGDRRYPCLWLLHGMHGAESDWPVKGRAHLTAERLMVNKAIPEAVVMFPSDGLAGDGTWYQNGQAGPYGDYYTELMDHVETTFPIQEGDRPHGVIGLSMGGFGAFVIGDREQHRVRAVYSHSGAIGDHRDERAGLNQRLIEGQGGPHPLQLGADCGVDDFLIEGNRAWRDAMTQAGVDHHYQEHPGTHTWDYWTAHVAAALRRVGGAFASSG